MEEQPFTKKQQREQRRQEKLARKDKVETKARNKKIIFLSVLILATIALVWGIAASQKGGVLIEDVSPDPSTGPETAKVLIKEYADFQCPACAATAPVLHDILEEYGDQVRFEFNDFPLPQHANAVGASIAAQCAFDQNKFFDLYDILYARQDDWAVLEKTDAENRFTEYASEIGLDMTAFALCTTSDSAAARVNEDLSEGRTAKINSTPTFLVNGQRIINTPFSTNLRKAIDDALIAGQ